MQSKTLREDLQSLSSDAVFLLIDLREIEVAASFPKGPKPSFGVHDALKMVILVGRKGPVGRKTLSKELHLGEGSVRTLILKLRGKKLLADGRRGCSLSSKGRIFLRDLLETIDLPIPVDAGRLSLGSMNVALAVRKVAHKVGFGIEQRDAAVRAGANGANTLVYSEGRFTVKGGSSDCARDFPDGVWRLLESLLKPEDRDVVLVCGAEEVKLAEDGVMAAAWTLIG